MLKTTVLLLLLAVFVFAQTDTEWFWRRRRFFRRPIYRRPIYRPAVYRPPPRYIPPRPRSSDPVVDAIYRFKPVIYIPRSERYYPSSIQQITTWKGVTDAQLVDDKYTLHYSFKGPATFDPSAPLYVNIRKQPNGRYWFVYVIIQAFNGCGPDLRVTATAAGVGPKNTKVTLCPFGVHWGDHEHVTVETTPDLKSITRVSISYHQWSTWYNPNQLTFDDRARNRVQVFMADGSHALYYKPGPHRYLKLWDESADFKLPCAKMCSKNVPYPCGVKRCSRRVTYGCPKICKRWRIRYPCGWRRNCGSKTISYPCGVNTCTKRVNFPCPGLCPHKAITSGYFVDYTPASASSAHAHRWDAPLRIVAKDGKPIPGIPEVERKMCLFKGRFGPKNTNKKWSAFESTILNLTYPVRKLSSKADSTIRKALKEGSNEALSTASSGLGGKSWFGDNNPNEP